MPKLTKVGAALRSSRWCPDQQGCGSSRILKLRRTLVLRVCTLLLRVRTLEFLRRTLGMRCRVCCYKRHATARYVMPRAAARALQVCAGGHVH